MTNWLFTFGAAVVIIVVTLPLGAGAWRKPAGGLDVALLHWNRFGDLDVALNVLLFVPFGVALAKLLADGFKARPWSGLAAVVFAALAFSYAVEVLQAFTVTRKPSLFDVASNGAGAFIGAIGLWAYQSWNVRAIVCLYGTVLIVVSAVLQHHTSLSNWDVSYPLVLGNEATGDRPWRGRIFDLRFSDEVNLPSEASMTQGRGQDLLRSLRWHAVRKDAAESVVIDSAEQWANEPLAVGTGGWLQSAAPPAALTAIAKKSSRFTLDATVASDDTQQGGPARIVSLSKDPNNRNFTLAQDRADLVVRLRTPVTGENGTPPELRVAGVFATGEVNHIRLLYDGSSLSVYVNGVRMPSTYQLTPGYVASTYFPLRSRINLDMNLSRLIYYVMTFLPMGILLSAHSTVRSGARLRFIIGCVLSLAVGLELVLVAVSGKALDWRSVAVALLCGAAGVGLGELFRTRPQALSGLKLHSPSA